MVFVTGTVELIVTPEIREKITLKGLKREKARAKEIGVIDLGEIDGNADDESNSV